MLNGMIYKADIDTRMSDYGVNELKEFNVNRNEFDNMIERDNMVCIYNDGNASAYARYEILTDDDDMLSYVYIDRVVIAGNDIDDEMIHDTLYAVTEGQDTTGGLNIWRMSDY